MYRHSRRSRGSTVRQLAVGAFLDTRASCHLNPRTIRRQPFKPRKAAKLRYFDEVYYACYDLNSFHKSFFEFKAISRQTSQLDFQVVWVHFRLKMPALQRRLKSQQVGSLSLDDLLSITRQRSLMVCLTQVWPSNGGRRELF